jgi:hypothetical protein
VTADSATKQPDPSDLASGAPVADVAPHVATKTRVRVDADGTALVGGKRRQFGRSLAGALVTVEA